MPDPEYWSTALARLAKRERPPTTEKFGYILSVDGIARGAILTIASQESGTGRTIVNLSSWFVEEEFRGMGRSLRLYRRASSRADVTYTNLTPSDQMVPLITAFGFVESTSGQMAAVGLSGSRRKPRGTKMLGSQAGAAEGLSDEDLIVLEDHEALGCLTMCLRTPNGLEPLIFIKRKIKGTLPCAQLVLCRSSEVLTEFGSTVTGALWRRGYAFMLVDCSAPIDGLVGRYVPQKRRRFYRGEATSHFVDHTYSELVYLPGVT